MIKSKKMLSIAIILSVGSIVLSFPFPHAISFGESLATSLNIPIRTNFGLHYVGVFSLGLFIASLYFLNNSVNKYNVRLVILAILVIAFAPMMLINIFQKTIASGVYAVSYESEWSNCQFGKMNQSTLLGECVLPFENHSNDGEQFTIEFYEEYYFEGDVEMITLMNNNTPYVVELLPKERKIVKIESRIDVSEMENYIEGGSATGINIIIKSDGKDREL